MCLPRPVSRGTFVPFPVSPFLPGNPCKHMLYIKELIIILMLVVVVFGSAADIVHDYREGAETAHLVVEAIVVVVSFTLIGVLGAGVWRQSRSNGQLKAELAAVSKSLEKQPPAEFQAARHNLAMLIERQFTEWELTKTEQEVAMLLLKGLSFKEIAAVRDTLEKTVRQQASSIYRKSGLSGRHAFAAWFIEDFL
jgi:DNA-binding CsgD family transcriptional regulator